MSLLDRTETPEMLSQQSEILFQQSLDRTMCNFYFLVATRINSGYPDTFHDCIMYQAKSFNSQGMFANKIWKFLEKI